jgi:hypothetical protein
MGVARSVVGTPARVELRRAPGGSSEDRGAATAAGGVAPSSHEVYATARSWVASADFSTLLSPGVRIPLIAPRVYSRAAGAVAQCTTVVLRHLFTFPDVPSYHALLFALPQLLWRVTGHGAAAQTRAILRRCQRFLGGEWEQLFTEAERVAERDPPSGGDAEPGGAGSRDRASSSEPRGSARQGARASPPLSPARGRSPRPGTPGTVSKVNDEAAWRARRCKDLFYRGSPSKALAALTSAPLAPADDTTIRLLSDRHPPAEQPIPPHLLDPGAGLLPSLTRQQVLHALHTSSRGSAGGPSGWTFEHLRLLASSSEAEDLLADLVLLLARGQVPDAARGLYTSSRLIPLDKRRPDGSRDVRPVAVGEVFLRLAGRALCLATRVDFVRLLLPHQFGVGVSCGAESVVRVIQRVLHVRRTWVVLALDLRNAFNEVERRAVFEGVERAGLTHLLPYLQFAYGTASDLRYQAGALSATLDSARGVRQGDPLGPALFALAIHHCLQRAAELFQEGVQLREDELIGEILAYLDDLFLMGPIERVAAAYRRLRADLAQLGLEVQPAKCVLYCPGGVPEDLPEEFSGMRRTDAGLEVLGVPLGTPDFVREHVAAALVHHQRGLEELHGLKDSQMAFLLMRQCVAGRPDFLCRLLDPSQQWLDALQGFDEALWIHLRRLLGWRPGDPDPSGATAQVWAAARDQSFLPVGSGGLGLRSASLLAPLGYLCSWGQTLPALLTHFPRLFPTPSTPGVPDLPLCPGRAEALRALRSTAPEVASSFPPESAFYSAYPQRLYQGCSRRIHALRADCLLQHPGVGVGGGRSRLRSAAGLGAGAWVTARPCFSGDRLSLASADWQFAARFRLGLPMEQLQVLGRCPCGQGVTAYDTEHVLRCARGRQLYETHEAVIRAVVGVLQESGHATQVHTDQRYLREYFTTIPPDLPSGADECIPDVTFFQRGAFTEHALDISVAKTRSGTTSGVAAATREREKFRKYAPWMALKGNGHFTPLAVEPFGCIGQHFASFLQECASSSFSHQGGSPSGCPPGVLAQLYRQRVGVALQQVQAHAFRSIVAAGEAALDRELRQDEAAVRLAHDLAAEVGGEPSPAELATVELERDW